MAGEGITISHWIASPVRYQEHFKTRNLTECTEDHRLFALPGPEFLLDVTQFKPEDILIQVFEGWLLIRGRHGVRMDEHGFAGDLKAMLCRDGILVVETKDRWWPASGTVF
uniref:Heat shock protein, alpha-crystallin-related, b3 n=1 Tax=Sinocyclocheilus anshuiensis TaxID=1608454 RepID=A0A671LJL4_9TELE